MLERTAHICAAAHAFRPFSPARGLLAMSHYNGQHPAVPDSVALCLDSYAVPPHQLQDQGSLKIGANL